MTHIYHLGLCVQTLSKIFLYILEIHSLCIYVIWYNTKTLLKNDLLNHATKHHTAVYSNYARDLKLLECSKR